MRRLELLLLLTFAVITGCDDRETEEKLAATEQALGQERIRRAAAEKRAAEAEGLAAELQSRGYPLTDLTLDVTISVNSLDGSSPPAVRRLATVAQLELSDGGVWKLIDGGSQAPAIQDVGNGVYNLGFRYQPENPPAVLGKDVGELSRIRGLHLRYKDILNSINLSGEFQVVRLSVSANGLTVVEAANPGPVATADESGFQRLEVTGLFADGPSRYAAALKERARSRGSQTAADGTEPLRSD